jgi:hypothetical protein
MENTAVVVPTALIGILNWTVLPSGTFSSKADGPWTFDPSTGVLVYTGSQAATYELSAWATVSPNPTSPVAVSVEMTVDVGGALLGQNTNDRAASLVKTRSNSDDFAPMAMSKVVTIQPGQAIRPVFRVDDQTSDILCQMSSLVARKFT